MPAILYPLPKIVKKFKTMEYSGGTSLDEIKKTQILKHSGRDAFHIFLDSQELSDYECNMVKVDHDEIDYSKGIALLIYAKPGIEFD